MTAVRRFKPSHFVIGENLEIAKAQMQELGIEDYVVWDEFWANYERDEGVTTTAKEKYRIANNLLVTKNELPNFVATTDQVRTLAVRFNLKLREPEVSKDMLFLPRHVWVMTVEGYRDIRDALSPSAELSL